MFIPTMIGDAPGLKAELSVWDAITRFFDEQTTLVIHHFPMFFPNGNRNGRREIDILLINELLGVCIIEVKGITIDQIEAIQGHRWSYKDYFINQGSPYQQAENQLHLLCSHLEKDPLLYRRLSKRVFVALPYITEKQWKERGFHEKIHIPLPVFKDDLEDENSLRTKLQSFALKEAFGKLTNLEMKKIHKILGVKSVVTTKKQTPTIETHIPFSRLYVVNTSQEFNQHLNEINSSLQLGTKVYILSYCEINMTEILNSEQYKKAFQLVIFHAKEMIQEPITTLPVTDGVGLNEGIFEKLTNHFPAFNIGQYKVIHQPITSHQMITAGAGTGKTHVMIDRIMFLLMNGNVPLKLFTMITFTNASTNEMKKRLKDKFIGLFNLTRNTQLLLYAEEVKDMQISTIHSFAKDILKELAHEMGYGKNVKLRSFVYDKKIIIQQLMNKFFAGRPIELFLETEIKDYDFVEFTYLLWEEMEKKGLTNKEIQQLDWGTVSKNELTVVHELLQYIFQHCESHLDKLKQEENSITIGDLIRKLKLFISSEEKMKQLSKGHFIFVDEFQDSDAVQIELLASLQRFLNYKLFVVGDIKQAIYRFRGADYKSFKELQDRTEGVNYFQTELQLNYRSSSSLLDQMHPLFERWHALNWLTYKTTDRLLSNEKSQFKNNDWFVSGDYKQELKHALNTLPNQGDKIALIVRTNRHALEIKEYCISQNIVTSENLDGTFFISQPVYDFKALVDGLLFPNEPKFLIDALQTPFFNYVIPYHTLIPFGGHTNQIISFIKLHTNDKFHQHVALLRTLSPMTVIQNIIHENEFFRRLPEFVEKQLLKNREDKEPSLEEVNLEVDRYKKNFQHLMLLIERQFESQNLTLQGLRDWLQLQIKTNRMENEPNLDQHQAKIEITTVHRSKGLEYHTVFLPITNSPFNTVEQNHFLEEGSESITKGAERKVGYKISVKGKVGANQEMMEHENHHYDYLKKYEDIEQLKEETRLLYVALTRAEQRVFITIPKQRYIKSDTWAYILKCGGLLDGVEV
ncbi:UvrD-helicase domain-containing protein [Alteribacter aurantiacus]|uniref:UvrD-helicase domain-containing protein n=1 Tax=Alteribacter aurantiacus TaxID=254410 RepID=UPI000411E807|nr:UvrD-helicase domain-containing protein [Alteribacter aurantiacus]